MKGRRWPGLLWSLTAFVVVSVESATGTLELPKWDSEDKAASKSPESGLWPGSSPSGNSKETERAELTKVEQTPSEKRLAEFVLLTKKKIEPVDPLIQGELPDDLPPLDEELLKQYFDERPSQFLIDPQRLVTEQKANDVLRFLEYHYEESKFEIYPVVLGHKQQIPEDINLHQLHEEWFGAQPAVLLIYQLLKPDSLQIIYNQPVLDKVSPSDLSEIRDHIITEAARASNSADQLEKIAIEMSIQAFVLEKLMLKPAKTTPPVELASAAETGIPLPEPANPEVISRPADVIELETIAETIKVQAREIANPVTVQWIVAGSALILVLALLFMLKKFIASRKTVKNPVLFPSYSKQERLGGEFSGGAFVGISFEMGRPDGRMG